jgi:hypothetical protein
MLGPFRKKFKNIISGKWKVKTRLLETRLQERPEGNRGAGAAMEWRREMCESGVKSFH